MDKPTIIPGEPIVLAPGETIYEYFQRLARAKIDAPTDSELPQIVNESIASKLIDQVEG